MSIHSGVSRIQVPHTFGRLTYPSACSSGVSRPRLSHIIMPIHSVHHASKPAHISASHIRASNKIMPIHSSVMSNCLAHSCVPHIMPIHLVSHVSHIIMPIHSVSHISERLTYPSASHIQASHMIMPIQLVSHVSHIIMPIHSVSHTSKCPT